MSDISVTLTQLAADSLSPSSTILVYRHSSTVTETLPFCPCGFEPGPRSTTVVERQEALRKHLHLVLDL